MKKPRRTTKVTIETERVFTFRNYDHQQSGWCPECEAETQMATVLVAAREVGLSELAIYQLLDAGALHFCEDPGGRVFVCLNSLCPTFRTAGIGSTRDTANQKGGSYESDE